MQLFIIDDLRFTKYLAEYQRELLYETCYSFQKELVGEFLPKGMLTCNMF